MDPELIAILNYLLSQGYLGPQSMQTGGFVVPQDYDDDGFPMGGPSTTQARGLTFAGNYNDFLADPMTAAQAGGQAFTAQAFEPIIEREEVDLPGRRTVYDYANRNPGSVENLIAQHIINKGTASSAFARIVSIINEEPTDAESAALKESIIASIRPMRWFDEVNQTWQIGPPDLDWVADKAEEIDKAWTSDPLVDEYSEDGLRGYNITETPSPLMEKFQQLGLPSPYEQYDVNQMMGPGFDQQIAGLDDLLQQVYATAEAQNAARRNTRAAEEQAAMGRLVTPGMGSAAPLPADVLSQLDLPRSMTRDRGMEPQLGVVAGDPMQQQMTQERWLAEYKAQGEPYGPDWRPGDFETWPLTDYDALIARNRASHGDDWGTRPAGEMPSSMGRLRDEAYGGYGSSRRPGGKRGDAPPEGRGPATSANARARGRSKPERAAQRARTEERRLGPSPTAKAYQDYVRAAREVSNDDYWKTYWQVQRAHADGRTPLSDVLSSRRAQAFAAGIPVGWT